MKNPSHKPVRFLLFYKLLFCLLCCSCSQKSIFLFSDYTELQSSVIDNLKGQGYVIADNHENYIATNWRTKLSPHYKHGQREKVNVIIEKQQSQYNVKITVLREINYSTQDTLNEQQAIWVPIGENYTQEKFLLALIKQKHLLEK